MEKKIKKDIEKNKKEKKEKEKEKEKEDKSGRPVEIPIIDPPRSPSITTTEEILKYASTIEYYILKSKYYSKILINI